MSVVEVASTGHTGSQPKSGQGSNYDEVRDVTSREQPICHSKVHFMGKCQVDWQPAKGLWNSLK